MAEPIVMENEPHERVEHCPRWNWENGSVSYGPVFSDPVVVQAFLDSPPVGVKVGELVRRTITTTRWEPVLPPSVLRLDQISGCEEYGGIKVAELGDGVVEGYTAVAFTDDVDKAFAAVRAHMVMVHNEIPNLSLFRQDEPVRWWQVYGTCGCGDVCRHIDGEDHDCKRWGLPPCRKEDEDGAAWIGELCEPDAPGAVPFVEVEVGESLTRDETVAVLRSLLSDAEQKLRELITACVAVRPVLDKPRDGEPETPWKRSVEKPAKSADFLRTEIRAELAWRTAGVAPIGPRPGGAS